MPEPRLNQVRSFTLAQYSQVLSHRVLFMSATAPTQLPKCHHIFSHAPTIDLCVVQWHIAKVMFSVKPASLKIGKGKNAAATKNAHHGGEDRDNDKKNEDVDMDEDEDKEDENKEVKFATTACFCN